MRLQKCFGVVAAVFSACLLAGSAAHAQSGSTAQPPHTAMRNDIALEGFGQYTGKASGDGITVTTTRSVGLAAFLRHSYHWWAGYETGYVYTRYTNYYTGQIFGRQANMHEFSGSYYIHAPKKMLFLEPFATAGISAILFSPSLNGGQNVPWQPRLGETFSGGTNIPLMGSAFGVRLEYRGVFYKTPDFRRANLKTGSHRLTGEPMAGLYMRF